MRNYSHILINSHLRSGGSLLARLLDGHPSLMVYPMEVRYARKKVFWPKIDKACHEKDFRTLICELDLEWPFRDIFRSIKDESNSSKINPKDTFGRQQIDLDYNLFLKGVEKRLMGENKWNFRKIVNVVADSFFYSWNSGENYKTEKVDHIVNHISMMCFANPQKFFNAFPDGFIIQTLREPKAWYASMKTHFKAKGAELFMKMSLALWFESTIRGLNYSKFFPDKYIVLRYEDLVVDTLPSMTDLLSKTGLEFDPVVLEPTIGQSPWLGNSSYGEKQYVDAASLQKWKNVLTNKEIHYIDEYYGTISEVLGYQGDDILPLKADSINFYDPRLAMDIPISAQSDKELLEEESRRTASMLYDIHRSFVLEYRKQSKKQKPEESKVRRFKAKIIQFLKVLH